MTRDEARVLAVVECLTLDLAELNERIRTSNEAIVRLVAMLNEPPALELVRHG